MAESACVSDVACSGCDLYVHESSIYMFLHGMTWSADLTLMRALLSLAEIRSE